MLDYFIVSNFIQRFYYCIDIVNLYIIKSYEEANLKQYYCHKNYEKL